MVMKMSHRIVLAISPTGAKHDFTNHHHQGGYRRSNRQDSYRTCFSDVLFALLLGHVGASDRKDCDRNRFCTAGVFASAHQGEAA